MKAALHVLPLQEQLLMLMAHLLLVRELLDLRGHKVNKVQPDPLVQQEQLALLAQQALREPPDHKVQQVLMVQTVPMALTELLVLKGHKAQLALKAHRAIQV
tara:strand:+ start:182 stop:487 length:306 start_codon:yes stop_codon:yes gene_type:complete